MKTIKDVLLITLLSMPILAIGQDSIFTRNEIIVANVSEITEESIKYSFPGETIINTVSKNLIKKIRFSSGRVQEFERYSNFQVINSWEDWEKVSVTQLEHELKGLIRLEEVTSKATGATQGSNVNRVRDRAFQKLKIEAAMLGGNVVFVIDQNVEGNKSGYYAKTAETTLAGVAYTEVTVSESEVNNYFIKYPQLNHIETVSQGNNDVEPNTIGGSGKFIHSTAKKEGAFVYITTSIPGLENLDTRIINIIDNKMILMYKDKKKLYNFIIQG